MESERVINKTEAKNLLSSVIEYFKQTYELKNSGKDNIKLNSTTLTPRQFLARYKKEEKRIAEFTDEVKYYSLMAFIRSSQKYTNGDDAVEFVVDKVFSFLKVNLANHEKKKVADVAGSELLEHSFSWANHFAILDVKTKKRVMYDSRRNCVDHGSSYDAWKEYLSTLSIQDRAIFLSGCITGVVTYNPYDIEEIQYREYSGQKSVVHVNAHITPEWRKLPKDSEAKLPKEFKQLMDHLFPNKACRIYVYHWLNFMMTSRNHCYLLLHGEQGIGKNTLASVVERLVGLDNYSYVEPTFWDDNKFNWELKHKRAVFFDETVINNSNLTSIRAYTNRHLAITEKGIDTIMYDNHCSFIIANNLDKVNLITFEDRRYSVPILSKTPIKTAFGLDWLDKFYDLVDDEKFIGDIGNWILANGDQGIHNEKQPYITSYFYDIVDKALYGWQSYIISMIESKEYEEIDLDGIKDKIKNTGRVKVSAFLDNHRDREGEYYGHVTQKHGGTRIIRVNKKYWPEHAIEFEKINKDSNTGNEFDDMEF